MSINSCFIVDGRYFLPEFLHVFKTF